MPDSGVHPERRMACCVPAGSYPEEAEPEARDQLRVHRQADQHRLLQAANGEQRQEIRHECCDCRCRLRARMSPCSAESLPPAQHSTAPSNPSASLQRCNLMPSSAGGFCRSLRVQHAARGLPSAMVDCLPSQRRAALLQVVGRFSPWVAGWKLTPAAAPRRRGSAGSLAAPA